VCRVQAIDRFDLNSDAAGQPASTAEEAAPTGES
jgi:hypothetical protein